MHISILIAQLHILYQKIGILGFSAPITYIPAIVNELIELTLHAPAPAANISAHLRPRKINNPSHETWILQQLLSKIA